MTNMTLKYLVLLKKARLNKVVLVKRLFFAEPNGYKDLNIWGIGPLS